MTDQLWPIFVEDGTRLAARLRDGLAAASSTGPAARALASDAYALATMARLMGVDDVGRLAAVCAQALDDPGAHPLASGSVGEALRESARVLVDALDVLAHPDASGARVDEAPLTRARAALEEAAALGTGEPPTPTGFVPLAGVRPGAAPAAAADPTVFTPTVDEDMLDLFFQEATERLDGLSDKLLRLEASPDDGELVREIFRDLHTVKGSSGMVGLVPVNRLAHAAEDLVGQLRDGARRAERPVVDALLATLDALRHLLERAARRAPLDLDAQALLRRLRDPGAVASTAAASAASSGPSPAAGAPVPGGASPAIGPAAGAAPGKHTLRVDFDKLDLLMNLVGELVLGKAGLTTGLAGLASLARALETERRTARKLSGARRSGEGHAQEALRRLGDELDRVERVFAELTQDLTTSSERLDHVSSDLRDQVMKLRMVPIAGTFRKHHRTVRDLAASLGKQARLELEGEDTELDKILVEQLEDPLMHLVRNSVDHGLEPTEARVAAGKPAEGQVGLRAYHRGNLIIIEVHDDGGGIDPARLRRKALEKGLCTAEELEALDDRQALELIFRPGFSTAARVSEISGRGVGMDVVRETIVSRLKGTVEVTSEIGVGTTFTLRLPLTLAIIQVLLVRAGGETFAVPLDVVKRTLTCAPGDVHQLYDREVLHVRERQLPLLRLRDVLELEGHDDRSGEELHVILCDVWGQEVGLVCERLLGKQEIVIKPLGDLLQEVPCAAGATLLGERCALILDVPAVVSRGMQLARGSRRPVASEPTRAASPVDGPTVSRGRRILLVEDSDVIREALRRLLVGAGYAVVEARDGAEGLARAEREDFDLISTDVMMPHVDGYELTRALRASKRHRDTPIVMVTSRGEKIDRVRGFDAGVDEYITKPHDRQELLAAIVRLLGTPAADPVGGDAP